MSLKIKLNLGTSSNESQPQPVAQQLGETKSTTEINKSSSEGGQPPPAPRKYKKSTNKNKHLYDEDDDEEPIPIEEHLIFRCKNEKLSSLFRNIIKSKKDFPKSIKISWKDPRRGILTVDGEEGEGEEKLLDSKKNSFSVKLVDLPCIIESQKTLDRKQFYKVCDISQMIVVGEIEEIDFSAPVDTVGVEELMENSGITPPMKYCRTRRFRRRIHRRTFESIEREVARLIQEDSKAIKVETIFADLADIDDRMYEGGEDDERNDNEDGDEDEEEDDETVMGEGESGKGLEDELAAELEKDLTKVLESTQSSDEEEGEEDEEDNITDAIHEVEEIEENERLIPFLDQQKLMKEEMFDLQEKIDEKSVQREKAINPLMKKRFDDIIVNLKSELELKSKELLALEKKIEDIRNNEADEEFIDQEDEEEEEEEDKIPLE